MSGSETYYVGILCSRHFDSNNLFIALIFIHNNKILLIIGRISVIVESTFLVLQDTLTHIYVLQAIYCVDEQYNWFSN